ncbi:MULTISPECIES: HPr family phosphocarrier protein [Oceanobacillus]|uniref:HPr family phosphocarrier protein n=1 Tax=Oceanobacillus aidingensis TaxID=645964 RepID=A0ABV9JY93_9BACI|nr:HPr family phosphocarrier protein [Oceanobacillus oncorhynchi]MDM8102464.1 HPr family phosphocarrier protein [Oceanobacillus oncorhynchi]
MIERYVKLDKINDVKDFVERVSRFEYKAEVISDTYILSAKSIMGIFSLDLTEPLKLRIHADSCDDLLESISPYLVDKE